MEQGISFVDPQTGELLELNPTNLNYLDQLISYYKQETKSHVDILKKINMNLAELSMLSQEKNMYLEYVRIQLASM